MRLLVAYLFFIACAFAPAQTTPAADPLTAELEAIAAAHHGNIALFAENLQTYQTVALSPDTPVQTASVIKLAILYEALQQIRDNKVHFNDPITLTKTDQVLGSGILHFFDAPLPLTFKDVLTMMIIMSDNAATNLAIDHLGLESINARINSLGLKDTYLYKKIFTPATAPMPADQKRFGLGKTTPREISLVMDKLVSCDLGSPSRPGDAILCAVALKMLQNQFYRSSIPRYLERLPGAAEGSIANKTGALDTVRNDVAAISTKNGLVILSVFTWDNADRSWGSDHEAELTIAKLARAIIASWSPQGLAPWPTPPATAKTH